MEEVVSDIPPKLARMRDMFKNMDRSRRIQMLIDIGESYKVVPAGIAAPPYPEDHKVPACESQAYVWAVDQELGLKFYFAVENPQIGRAHV